MSLFRQQALDQRRLTESWLTPVIIVRVHRWLWVILLLGILTLAGIWLLFGTLYITYETQITTTGTSTRLDLPLDMAALSSPLQAVLHCPQPLYGSVTVQSDHISILHLQRPVYAMCQVSIVTHTERPVEQLLP